MTRRELKFLGELSYEVLGKARLRFALAGTQREVDSLYKQLAT